jgi:hypothetical protein
LVPDGYVLKVRRQRYICATVFDVGPISIEGDTLSTEHAGCQVAVRVEADERGRYRPVEVRIAAAGGVAAEALRTLPLRAIEAAANAPMARFVLDATQALMGPETLSSKRPPLTLAVPAGPGRKPDAFYRKVATAYQWLAQRGRGPAAEIAKINGVPVTTVHRWLKEARARGLLAPGQKGRAT